MEMENKKSEAYQAACNRNQEIIDWCEKHQVFSFSDLVRNGGDMKPEWLKHLDNSLDSQIFIIRHLFYAKEKFEIAEARKRIFGDRKKRTILPCFCVETGTYYKSVREAARDAHVMPEDITKCCLGLQDTVKGNHYSYDLDAIKK